MPYSTLVDAATLRALLGRQPPADLVVLDCGFDLADAEAGQRAHAAGRLPDARYIHLERDLSGPETGRNGRHPLPPREGFANTVGRLGISPQTQVVTYDAQGGPYAARAWWMLRWLGHEGVAVLDGGPAAWRAAGGAWETGLLPAPPERARIAYPLSERAPMATLQADELQQALERGAVRLVDARAPERFRGEIEQLDPVAGHIPGARNHFFKHNLGADGRFKPAAELRAVFCGLALGNSGAALPVVHQCGSGVTACHNLLAMAHAGLDAGMLYPGSWSEWCANPSRPVARG